jgi:acyl-CoA thioesterase-1
MLLEPNDRILFTGDSITASRRLYPDAPPLGSNGYVAFTAARLQADFASPDLEILNRGIGGNRMSDLLARLEKDCLALKPTVVSILIGINDTWRRYDSKNPSDIPTFEANYRQMLTRIRDDLQARLVLLEPFLLHVPPDRHQWREDLNPRIDTVRRLAVEFDADLIPLDGLFAKAATEAPAEFWAADGVHPTPAGHALIAQAWLENAGMA